MKLKYLIPIWGFFLMFKEHPNGTDDLWGIGLPLYHGMIIGLFVDIIIFTFIIF